MRFLFILFALFANNSASAGYQGELYGATQKEREIKWAWRHLNDFVWSCAASKTHCQAPQVKSIVNQLVAYVPDGTYEAFAKWETLLVFVSEKERPELFKSDAGEIHRVAVTEHQKFSTVYINTDRMELPLEKWIGILSHELAHHLKIVDDSTRMPDQVGAEIQKHAMSRMQVSSMEQFKLPQTQFLTFNSQAPGKFSATLITDPDRSGDMSWAPTPFLPVCNPDENVASQFVVGPAWRVNRIQAEKALVGIRGAGYMRAVCEKKLGGRQRTVQLPMNTIVYLKYSKPFKFDQWMNETPERAFSQDEFGFSMGDDYQAFGPLQSFYVLSTEHEKIQLTAGEIWKTKVTVQGTDSFAPNQCEMYLAGSQYSYIMRDGLPGINRFSNCKVTNLGSTRWLIEGETQIPAETRSDYYSVVAIGLINGQEGRMAVPIFPTYVQVQSREAIRPPVIHGMSILGLKTKATEGKMLADQTLTNSFLVKPNDFFQISFLVEGPQIVSDLWMDMTIWLYMPGQDTFVPANGTGSSTSFPQVVKKEVMNRNAKGTEVLVTFQMPASLSGYPVAAIKMKRFYMRTSDYSWVEVESQELNDLMVVNSQHGR